MLVPFIPFHLPPIWQIFQIMGNLNQVSETGTTVIGKFDPFMSYANTSGWANDYTVSLSKDTPFCFAFLFCALWVIGMIAMLLLGIRSNWRIKFLVYTCMNESIHNYFLLTVFLI